MATRTSEPAVDAAYQERAEQEERAAPVMTLDEEIAARSRHSQRVLLEKQVEAALHDQADIMKVPFDMWRRLSEKDRRDLLGQGVPQDERPENAADAPRLDFGDVSSLDAAFAGRTRGLITRDERKDWVVVCDPVKFDPRWGKYTPGVSKMTINVARKKTDPQHFSPPFTLEPVADFPPDPTVACTMHKTDGTPCDFATYPDVDNPRVSILLMSHQRFAHPTEHASRDAQRAQDKEEREAERAREDREERRAMLAQLVETQKQNAVLIAEITALRTEKGK